LGDQKVKVLQINSVCGVGSTGRIATDIDKVLKKNGHKSYIAYGRGTGRDCDTTIKIGNNLDNYIHVVKTRLLDKHGLGSKRATIDFIKKIENLNPDIIHLHNIHGYYLNIKLLFEYLKNIKKPIVWTLHDCWAFTGHCAYFDYVDCQKWKTGCFSCPSKSSYPSSFFLDNSKNNYKEKSILFNGVSNMTIVTPSNWLACLVKQSFLDAYSVKVINNGVDLEVFTPTESSFKRENGLQNKFIILGVANIWGKRKGFDYFIQLSSELKPDEVIVLVGLTEQQSKNLPNNIIGITRTESIKKLAQIYSSADVFVNPTLEDNFPTTNLEALACGTPLITFNTGGSVECIDEGCGYIVEKGDIQELINNFRKVKKMGKSHYSKGCINRAVELYNKNDRYKDYLELYSLIK
jgi:glycosyltransferase involved in cell wall biosynthesis